MLASKPPARVKFALPELASQLERDWAQELAVYYGRTPDEILEKVRSWFDFPSEGVRIELPDSSIVSFNWAIHIVSLERRAIAVFTEHCGHHIFPIYDAKVFIADKLVFDSARGWPPFFPV
jgi:hypothetical protein